VRIELSLTTPPIAVEIKCQQQTLMHTIIYQTCALGNIEKASCFLYLLQFENTTSVRQTMIEYVWSGILPSNYFRWCRFASFILEWQAICAAICRINLQIYQSHRLLQPWCRLANIKQTMHRWQWSHIFNALSSCKMIFLNVHYRNVLFFHISSI